MVLLLAMISGGLTTIMLIIKQAEARLTQPTDATQLAAYSQRLDLINFVLSLVLSLAAAISIVMNNAAIFAGDAAAIQQNPILFAVFAGLVSVLPGGYGTSILSGLLIWFGVNPPPPVSPQAIVNGKAKFIRSIPLWR